MTTDTRVSAAEVASHMGQLPPMPQVAGRVLALLESTEATSTRLQKVIESDPALTAAVLRLVNSAMFSLPNKIGTLSHAITLIGFLRLKSLTMATIIAGVKGIIPERAALRRDQIWEHSVNVALAARVLAERQHHSWSEEAFLAGMLHDCGRLVLLAQLTDEYMRLMDGALLPSLTDEQATLGLDHQQVGAALLRQWGLSDQLVTACSSHHGDAGLSCPYPDLLATVMLADRMMPGEPPEDPVPPARRLGFEADEIDQLTQLVRHRAVEMRTEFLAL